MFFTKTRTANLDSTDATALARAAGQAAQAAAQNAATAARAAAASAQLAAQNVAQTVAQTATETAQTVAETATEAAQNVGSTAQTTAAGVGKQLQQGVNTARNWAAPRLESVADYATTTVAPTVSTALRNTANQVRPAPAKRRTRSALTWSLLGAAILAAAGAVTALARYRRRAAMAVDSETAGSDLGETATDVPSTPTGGTPTGPTPTGLTPTGPVIPAAEASPSASANQTKTVTDASVNGRASTNG